MRCGQSLLTLWAVGLLAWPALAQPPEGPGEGGPPPSDPAVKQKLLDAFDTNQDGTIDRAEARAIGRGLRENFGIGPGPGGRGPEARRGPAGPPPDGPPPADDGDRPSARRGPEGRGPEGRGPEGRGPEGRRGPGRPDGPPGPPNPERIFNLFDENKDGSLSKEEFRTLTEFMRAFRPFGPPMAWRDGPGFERRGMDGPPRGDFPRRGEGHRGGWWREGPPGPPPGPGGPPPGGPPPEDDPPPEGDAPEEAI